MKKNEILMIYFIRESDEEVVDEMLYQSPMKNSTRSKSRKVVVPEPLILSDSEDEEDRPQQCKRNRASPAPLRAGIKAKFFRRGSVTSHVQQDVCKTQGKSWRTGTKVTNSRLRARRLHAHDYDMEFIFLPGTIFFSLCGCSRVQMYTL
jgi:hypothetical protein